MRREIPLVICFISGLVVMIQFYVPRIEALGDMFNNWFAIISAFAFILGAASLLLVHGKQVLGRARGWGYDASLLVAFFAALITGLAWGIGEGSPCDWLFRYVFSPLNATMFSLLAFFIASAAFRAFKAKTLEATLLLATAFIVILGRVPIGEYLWRAAHLDQVVGIDHIIETWLMGGINTAGQRAILLGASVGLISTSLKILLGIERSYLGGE